MGAKKAVKPAGLLFLGVFSFHLGAGIFVQTILPALLPQAHLGNGLFVGDARNVHADAAELAEHGRQTGWSWAYFMERCHDPRRSIGTLFPWLTAAVYRLLVPSPLVMLPISACLAAWASVLIFQILQKSGFGLPGALAGGIWLGCFPGVLEWSTQPLREGFFVAGHLLLLRSFFLPRILPALGAVAGGCWMVFFARPSWSQLLAWQGGLVLFFLLGLAVFRFPAKQNGLGSQTVPIAAALMIVGCSLAGSWLLRAVPPSGGVFDGYRYRDGFAGFPPFRHGTFPGFSFLDAVGAKIYGARTTQLQAGGRSLLDAEKALGSLRDQVAYLPRALLVSLAAPFVWAPAGAKSSAVEVASWDPRAGILRLRVGNRPANLAGHVLRFRAAGSPEPPPKDYIFQTHEIWREVPPHAVIEISTRQGEGATGGRLERGNFKVSLDQAEFFRSSSSSVPPRWDEVVCLPHGGGAVMAMAKQWLALPMLISHLALAGLVASFWIQPRHPRALFPLLYGVPILLFLALVCPNLGTLLRVRYAFWAPLTAVGVAWWCDLWARRGSILQHQKRSALP